MRVKHNGHIFLNKMLSVLKELAHCTAMGENTGDEGLQENLTSGSVLFPLEETGEVIGSSEATLWKNYKETETGDNSP